MSNDKSQLDKFKEAARELGTDDDEERFDEIVKKVAKSAAKKDKKKDQQSKDH